jgi:hypothetical protein
LIVIGCHEDIPMAQPFQGVELPAELIAHGRVLSAIGVAEVAWPRTAALELLPYLRDARQAVLGGDVIAWSGNQPRYIHDNWHSEPVVGENFTAFAARSHADTVAYIERYHEAGREIGYVLVVADSLPHLNSRRDG